MKIGLVTAISYGNYGSLLQAVALNETIKSLGHEVKVIHNVKNILWQGRKDNLKREGLLRFFVVRSWNRLKRLLRIGYFAVRYEKFIRFCKANISSADTCHNKQELEDIADKFDAVVCGSDQIWTALNLHPFYYLDFVHDKAKKLAYAPSIDTNHVKDNELKRQIIDLAGDFEFISVRERKPAEVLSCWLNRYVKAVLDPALLLNGHEWEK